MPPPSSPRSEITASPRLRAGPACQATPLTGMPNRAAICADHSTRTPMLAGRNGASGTPAARRASAQAPSEPSRAQLAPPSASTVTPAVTRCTPSGVAKTAAPSAQPCQRQRVRRVTPYPSSRVSQARSSFIVCGKTRPVGPVNSGWPSASAQRRTSSGPQASSIGRRWSAWGPKAARNLSKSSDFVRFSPDFPAMRNLRAGEGLASASRTACPACPSTSAAISPAGPAPMTSAATFMSPQRRDRPSRPGHRAAALHPGAGARRWPGPAVQLLAHRRDRSSLLSSCRDDPRPVMPRCGAAGKVPRAGDLLRPGRRG